MQVRFAIATCRSRVFLRRYAVESSGAEDKFKLHRLNFREAKNNVTTDILIQAGPLLRSVRYVIIARSPWRYNLLPLVCGLHSAAYTYLLRLFSREKKNRFLESVNIHANARFVSKRGLSSYRIPVPDVVAPRVITFCSSLRANNHSCRGGERVAIYPEEFPTPASTYYTRTTPNKERDVEESTRN